MKIILKCKMDVILYVLKGIFILAYYTYIITSVAVILMNYHLSKSLQDTQIPFKIIQKYVTRVEATMRAEKKKKSLEDELEELMRDVDNSDNEQLEKKIEQLEKVIDWYIEQEHRTIEGKNIDWSTKPKAPILEEKNIDRPTKPKDPILEEKVSDGKKIQKLRMNLEHLLCMRNEWYYKIVLGNNLFLMAPDMITFALVMFMGVLGGLLKMTIEYFNREVDQKFIWFLLKPSLGAGTAIAVFIIAKAGQLTLGSQNTENLNIYVLSFLGIISGIGSEEAIRKISRKARKIFNGEAEKNKEIQRWIIKDSITRKPLEPELKELRKLLEVEEKHLSNILGGEEKASIREQKIISAWFRRNLREMFSDIKNNKE